MQHLPIVSNLVEGGTRRYVRMMLLRSHDFRVRHYNFLFNIGLLVAFVLLISGVLYYMYHTKETKDKTRMRKRLQRNYVIDKLHAYNHATRSIDGAYNTPLSANNAMVSERGYGTFEEDDWGKGGQPIEVASSSHYHTSNLREGDAEIRGRYGMGDLAPEGTSSVGGLMSSSSSVLNEEEVRRALQQGVAYSRPTRDLAPSSGPSSASRSSSWLYSMIEMRDRGNAAQKYAIPKYSGVMQTVESSLV